MQALAVLALAVASLSSAEVLLNADFEASLTGNWYCKGCTPVKAQSVYKGSGAYQTSKRSGEWSGPAQKLALGTQVAFGKNYHFQSYVKLVGSSAKETLKATLAYTLQDGTINYVTCAMDSIGSADGWKLFSGNFLVNGQAQSVTSLEFYIEGPLPAMDFIVDAVSIQELDWKSEANKRIEALRKRDVKITLTTSGGGSADNVKIQVTQKTHHFGFGTAIDADMLINNAKYRQYFLDHFEWAVFENDMKWYANEGQRGQLTFSKADAAMKILEDNKKKLRGHTVFWADKSMNPSWVQQLTGNDLANACWKRVDDLVGRYAGRIKHWDVNNEMLPHKFYEQAFGSKQINYDMYKKVNAKDKNALLFLNDYNVFAVSQRTDAYLAQAKEFLQAGVPVHGIGVQGHFGSRQSPSELVARLDKLAQAGLPIWVTELDYTDTDVNRRADVLEEILRVAFSHNAVQGVLFWGFWDQRHWKGAAAAMVNGDNLQANAAGLRYQQLFHKEWSTNLSLLIPRVSGTGSASSRVFHGVHEVKVTVNGVTVAQTDFQVLPGSGLLELKLTISPPTVVG